MSGDETPSELDYYADDEDARAPQRVRPCVKVPQPTTDPVASLDTQQASDQPETDDDDQDLDESDPDGEEETSDDLQEDGEDSGDDDDDPQDLEPDDLGILLAPGIPAPDQATPSDTPLPQMFPCSMCNLTFLRQRNLEKHALSHKDSRTFTCEFCAVRFTSRSNLRTHYRTHTGEKPYACDQCDAVFSQPNSRNRHVRARHSEKEFDRLAREESLRQLGIICSICQRPFGKKKALSHHFRIMHCEQPFACSYCQARFSYRSGLEKHERTHTGAAPFTCSKCNFAFTQHSSLRRHMKVHTEDKEFKCTTCPHPSAAPVTSKCMNVAIARNRLRRIATRSRSDRPWLSLQAAPPHMIFAPCLPFPYAYK
eukprot:m.20543 g.20543  ORF g.20543 m.20543 type:complete len:368 (+) comp32049_c0_seq1:212-1315(+)